MGKDDVIIDIRDLTKTFFLERTHYGFKNIVLHLPQYIKDRASMNLFTALDHVSLQIRRGERIALTGHNGCGKTTLLSIIGGVYKNFEGEVSVRGRVSMILALGAGFSDQLSGRENIFLNGILQGKTRREMEALADDIIDFAGIGDFIDAPIYQYSSGMKARLGFGIITAIDPEILLVDEVLAVGDSDFQEKCSVRINKLLKRGTTLVLVSHSRGMIERYCTREIRLDHGKIIHDGPLIQTDKKGIELII